jgi:uncharacterized protein (DUF697 family)
VALGIGIGQVVGLVRDTRQLESASAQIAVAGFGAEELAAVLTAGGEPAAVCVDGDPMRAAVAIRLIDGAPSPGETDVLRRLSRAGTPLLVVRRGRTAHIPYVLPGDVLDGGETPDSRLVAAIARVAGSAGPALAARLPALRPAVTRRLIATTAVQNAAIAASPRVREARLPLLSIAQARMLLLLGVSRGDVLPRDPQELALAAGPSVGGSVAVGVAARALVRRSPLRGPLIEAAVAYAGTWALGAARLRR